MSTHFTPQGPYTTSGPFTAANANNIETGIGAVDTAKPDIGTGNMQTTPAITFIMVGPTSAALPSAGVKGRVAIVVTFTPS